VLSIVHAPCSRSGFAAGFNPPAAAHTAHPGADEARCQGCPHRGKCRTDDREHGRPVRAGRPTAAVSRSPNSHCRPGTAVHVQELKVRNRQGCSRSVGGRLRSSRFCVSQRSRLDSEPVLPLGIRPRSKLTLNGISCAVARHSDHPLSSMARARTRSG
jgi:hypothetical protein